eukprot:350649-Chlamydomonas_euryale.AAC.5
MTGRNAVPECGARRSAAAAWIPLPLRQPAWTAPPVAARSPRRVPAAPRAAGSAEARCGERDAARRVRRARGCSSWQCCGRLWPAAPGSPALQRNTGEAAARAARAASVTCAGYKPEQRPALCNAASHCRCH